jgi:alginate O-acetyltransferase complex protein AlgI
VLFSSFVFLFAFLPVFLGLYYLAPSRWRNAVALAGSVVFYAWGAPRFLVILLLSTALDYGISKGMERAAAGTARRRWLLGAAVGINLLLFLYCKYANFFVDQVGGLMTAFGGSPIGWTKVALPVGISFITFHKISYLVDVYRGTVKGAPTFGRYLLYILLFPQLIAGPILRYHWMADQLGLRVITPDHLLDGAWRFCRGLGRKVLVANVLGEVADRIFGVDPSSLSTPAAWLGILCYTMQIYFDFAGYSDMAFGLGRMMGFSFVENFNHPYTSRSFTEFWRRWHISLSAWMREYLYIPLGGNRVPRWRIYANLWIVFLLSGFWHGASWSFVVWGAYHGLFLTLDKLFWSKAERHLPGAVAIGINFLLVMVGWVFFRASDLPAAVAYLGRMAGIGEAAAKVAPLGSLADPRAWLMLAIALLLSFAPALPKVAPLLAARPNEGPLRPTLAFAGGMVLLVLSAAALATGTFNPFIYFRF